MSYQKWFETHAKKHKDIIAKISYLTQDEIIKYFDYDNMQKYEPDFCPLYAKNKKCHNIENLNCFLCGCPNFRIKSNCSYCNIQSKYGKQNKSKNGFVHQDCSNCTIAHQINFINKVFNKDWKIIMKDCFIQNR